MTVKLLTYVELSRHIWTSGFKVECNPRFVRTKHHMSYSNKTSQAYWYDAKQTTTPEMDF